MPGTFLYRETASAAQTIIAGIQLPPLLRVENGGFVENGLLAETHFLHRFVWPPRVRARTCTHLVENGASICRK